MMTNELAGLADTIGRYQVRGLLGRGGMGRVVLGHDPVLGREVALKLVEPGAIDPKNLAELRFMFHREARATASLRHPGIVEVYDYSGPEAELLFLACEKLDGHTLREVFEKHGILPPHLVASLGHELAEALAHAHEREIIHRDIKPENIFWLPSGRVVLSDFGIAKAFDGSSRLGNTVQFGATSLYGSPAYMAPEQFSSAGASPTTDLHALGAILYEALTGKQAFDGPTIEAILNAVLNDARPSLAGKTDGPPQLTDTIHRLLAKDTNARPTSAREVATSLRAALDALDVTDPRATLRESGDETAVLDFEEEDEESTEMFAQPQSERIQARSPQSLERRSRMAALMSRGPVVLGMLGLSVLLGAGAYMFIELSELPGRSQLFPAGPVVVTDPGEVATTTASSDIFVLFKFPGRAEVWVDGSGVGSWQEQVRLGLSAGPHTLEVRFKSGAVSKEVVLIADTSPVFEFVPPEPTEDRQDLP